MRNTFAVLTIILALTCSGAAQLWSKAATSIWSVRKTLTIQSPDKQKAILVEPIPAPDSDATTVVTVKAHGRMFKTKIGTLVNAEVQWSPNSQAFFLTYSDGGNIGTYHVKVVYVTASGLRVVEPVADGRRLLNPRCFDPERPNVVAVAWLGNNSESLLIALQVPPHSSCASMGTFRSFAIALPSGEVRNNFDQIKSKQLFGNYLGNQLKNADDSCVRKPNSCIPTGLKTR